MEINFTKNEYRLLLDMISIAEWVMRARKTEDDPNVEPYNRLEQKILSLAKEFGCDDLIEYSKEFDKYYPTADYEESETFMGFIDDFEEDVFWDELGRRLAQRDLLREEGSENFRSMNPTERFIETEERAEAYYNEFVENGLKNLVLKE